MKAIYTRINKEGDLRKYEQQLKACRSYIEDEGNVLYFHDVASGNADSAPGLSALLEAARTGVISQVIVSSIDRLSRRYDVARNAVNEFHHFGAKIFAVDMEKELVDDGLLIIYFAFQELLHQERSNRIKEGIARAKERRNQQLPSNQA